MMFLPCRSLTILFIFPILLIACSKETSDIPERIRNLDNLSVYPTDVQPIFDIDFEREISYGNTDEVLLGSIGAISVDEIGRVYIADNDKLNIHVYSSNGQYITDVGEKGKGPGDLSYIRNIKFDSNRMYVYDYNQQRIQVFTLGSLDFSHTVNLAENRGSFEELSGTRPGSYFILDDGTFLTGFSRTGRIEELDDRYSQREHQTLYYILDQNGKIISDKLMELKSSTSFLFVSAISFDLPFYGKQLVTLSMDDLFYTAWSEDFLIKVYGSDGSYRRAFYLPYRKSPLTGEDVNNVVESGSALGDNYERVLQLTGHPDTWPALNSMQIDDQNRLWISTIVDERKVYRWWVLDENGKLLTRFTWPRDQPIEVIKNGSLYVRETAEETGIQKVVQYRVSMD